MSGEVYLEQWRAAKEVSFGTPVTPATRRLYVRPGGTLNDAAENYYFDAVTGTPEQVVESGTSPQMIEGSVEFPVSADELVEWASITIKGGVTPTTPAMATTTRDWTFVPGAPDSMTLERDDAARPWMAAGVKGTSLQITGSADGDNMARVNLLGASMVQQALSGTPTARTPSFIRGWETKVFIDAWGGTLGTTAVDGLVINWDVTFNRPAERIYAASNSQSAVEIPSGVVDVTASFTVRASPAQALTEWTNARTATKRLIRLEMGNNSTIETTFKRTVTLDLPMTWRSREIGGDQGGIRVYSFQGRGVYSPTDAFSYRLKLRNDRSAAF